MPCNLLTCSVYELPVPLTKDLFNKRLPEWFVKVIRFDDNFIKVHFIVSQISFLF